MSEEIYYTYTWLREDKTPYYIGKGKKHRAWRRGSPPKERVLILKKNLCEQDAFKHEVYMIFILGRKDKGTGILRNLTDGGEGCAGHYWEHTEEWRAKVRESMKGKNKGRKHSEESRRRFSEAHIGARLSESHKKRISKALRGKKKPARSEEHRRKLGEAARGREFSEETRRKLREARKGYKWFHNPVSGTATRCLPENCPNGYLPGRKVK